MDADSLSLLESVSQLELSVDRNMAALSRDNAVLVEAKLQMLLWGVRGHLNGLSSVNRLPPEMLAAIFRQVVRPRVEAPMLAAEQESAQHQHGHPNQKEVDMRPQFRLAHVCRRWRSTALGDASLWARVDIQAYPEAAVKFFLQCAAGYPLTLHAPVEKAPLEDRILKDHSPRIRAVYLSRKQLRDALVFRSSRARLRGTGPVPFHSFTSARIFDTEEAPGSIFQYFCSYAPQLECFVLRDGELRPRIPVSPSGPAPELSPLKALALRLPEAYFPRNSFPNLTHLFLSFPFPPSEAQECIESMLQMFSHTPQLQFLQLSNLRALTATSNDFTIPLPRVSLDHLRLLTFSDVQLEVVFYLLKYLVLPPAVLLSIDGSEGSNVNSNVLQPSLRLPPIAPLNTSTFMEISVDVHALLLTAYDAQLASSFVFKTRDFSDFWTSTWLPELHDMISLSRITVLHLNDNDGRVLPHLLPHFTQLTELAILLLPSPTVQGAAGVVQTARALFASLTPLTTLACPVLQSLGLEAEIDDESFPYTELQAMAVGRHHWRGVPLRRFVYMWHRDARPRSRAAADAEERGKMSLVEAALSPLLEGHVEAVEYRLSSSGPGEKLCPFVLRECWRARRPEAERYWRDTRLSYGMPWEETGFESEDYVWRLRMGEPDDIDRADASDRDGDLADFGAAPLSLFTE